MINATPTITELPPRHGNSYRVFQLQKQGLSKVIFLNEDDLRSIVNQIDQLEV